MNEIGTLYGMVIRECPESKNEWLRFQCGIMQERPEMVPVSVPTIEGRRIIGYRESDQTVQVFRLIAWGSTYERAHKMAERVWRKMQRKSKSGR